MDASLAQSAVQLPWLAPSAPALAALARGEPATHPSINTDPAAVLLLLRHSDNIPAALTAASARLREAPAGVLDRGRAEVRAVLGFVRRCAAVAKLIAEAGPAKASVITYVNPLVAVVAGVLALHEQVGIMAVAGLVLILGGSWLSAGGLREDLAGG